MRLVVSLLAALWFCAPAAALAQRSPVVVELFTSQGCSACPPADELLAELSERPNVIALALHVDIWDYLGWRDTFGQAAHSARQRAYAAAARKRSVYTPQIIVQGVDRVVGADGERLRALVAAHQERPVRVHLEIARAGEVLTIRLAPTGPAGVGPSDVHVVRFIGHETVEIRHGENAGHTIPYSNIVTDWSNVARWDGRTPAEFAVAVGDRENVAVIVQRESLGPVLSAAKLP